MRFDQKQQMEPTYIWDEGNKMLKTKSDFQKGLHLFHEQRYSEAEEVFRQAMRGEERTLGQDHKNTLDSKSWLGTALYKQNKHNKAEEVLQQAVRGQERILGQDHKHTLDSKYTLGLALYKQNKHSKAEEKFRQVASGWERTLGRDHKHTLEGKYWLGVALYEQNKHSEAEEVLRQATRGQERTLGQDHEHTLNSKYTLGLVLYRQNKHSEAAEVLRQVARSCERTLGQDHNNTLDSKYWLGVALYEQNKHSEAEEMLQQAARGQERTLGQDHKNTLDSKYWLGVALYKQNKHSEAEEVLRQVARSCERTLGQDHKHTLDSKSRLGLVLYKQNEHSKAEEVLRQVARGREHTFGQDHKNTLDSKYLLAKTLYEQQKHAEAEQLSRYVARQREKALGVNHKDTLASKELLQKAIHANTESATTKTLAEAVFSRLSNFFADGSHKQTGYTDVQILQVSRLLRQVNLQWCKVPRLYIVLRTIDCLTDIDNFIDLGCSDHWLPFTEQGLPSCLRPSKRSQFVDVQSLVMTKSMDLEKGQEGQHCHFREQEPLPFEMKGILGSGAFGQVDRVVSTISFQEYALKRVSRRDVFRGRTVDIRRKRACVQQFIAEIEILKRLKHRHVVEFVGSYTDVQHMGLIMSPVADMDLSTYLACADTATYRELRTFFGCLARALEFLHAQSIRHKDIKPSNILVHGGNVLFTDFGLAFDFTDQEGSTTASMVNGMTPKYCAPEVANYEPRNTLSDIWSLGVVFLEMVAVLKGRPVEHVYDFLKEHGTQQTFVRTNLDGTHLLIAELRKIGSPADNAVLGWVRDMVVPQALARPTAMSLIASITSASQKEGGNEAFCGICCVSHDDAWSDFDELDIADTV
jgi:TolA-binding protein/tRNA A-37 threonylcarbamoyl transferase component Bud32